jgi:hypothetical protein
MVGNTVASGGQGFFSEKPALVEFVGIAAAAGYLGRVCARISAPQAGLIIVNLRRCWLLYDNVLYLTVHCVGFGTP